MSKTSDTFSGWLGWLQILAAISILGCVVGCAVNRLPKAPASNCGCYGTSLIEAPNGNCIDNEIRALAGEDETACGTVIRETLSSSSDGCPCRRSLLVVGRESFECLSELRSSKECLEHMDQRLMYFDILSRSPGPNQIVREYYSTRSKRGSRVKAMPLDDDEVACVCAGAVLNESSKNCVDKELVALTGLVPPACEARIHEIMQFSEQGCRCTQTLRAGEHETTVCLEHLSGLKECLDFWDPRLINFEIYAFSPTATRMERDYYSFRRWKR